MTTRFKVVQDVKHSRKPDGVRISFIHPDQPADGFPNATDAGAWAYERDLDGSWYIQPVEGA